MRTIKGPHCVGRADGPDECDCLTACGDDPWLKTGMALPCTERLAAMVAELDRKAAQLQLVADLQDAIALVDGDRMALVLCHSKPPQHDHIPADEPGAIAAEAAYQRALKAMRTVHAQLVRSSAV
ncbi:hypothetical protein [Roseateles cavernae]|uniref:hypothetical protein n=1 Tax=Roseateles cavernae TaxID=3153578 RepID=UPI0032E38CA7